MALSPDVIFELFLPAQPSTDETVQIIGFVQGGLPVKVQKSEPAWNPNNNVLSTGFWIEADGFTTDQLIASLRASSFISGSGQMTAGLFLSKAVLQGAADITWEKQPKTVGESLGHIDLGDNIPVEPSSGGIVTKISGSYHPEVLPGVGFTYTISDSFTIDQSGALQANESTHLQLDTGGIVGDADLLGMIAAILQGEVYFETFGALFAVADFDPHAQGVGAQLAASWPGPNGVLTPISPPLTGKLIFTWSKVNVDDSGIRTVGTWNLALRSPQVQIVGPTALSFKEKQPGVTAGYTVNFTDLRDGVIVVWGGDAEGGGTSITVQFEAPGNFSIQATVTDVDNVSATDARNVKVTETRNGHEP
jgi:hypothetical protein